MQVSPSYDSADMINALAIQGDAGEGDVGMHAKDPFDGEVLIKQHYRARRHDFVNLKVVQTQRIRDQIAFFIGQGSFFGSFSRQKDDFFFITVFGFLLFEPLP